MEQKNCSKIKSEKSFKNFQLTNVKRINSRVLPMVVVLILRNNVMEIGIVVTTVTKLIALYLK
jgi:hypothetical protein